MLTSKPAHMSVDLAEHCEAALSVDGPLALGIDNFRSRNQQREMARHVAESIVLKKNLVIEAGTGIGKTFAYLVPVLLSNRKIVISTATRYLQDQIYHKDIPTVLRVLQLHRTVAMLKGRANYLCRERLDWQWRNPDLHKEHRKKVMRIYDWSQATRDGDISRCSTFAESDTIWQSLTSTAENCLGKDCPRYADCFVVKARQDAHLADVVVVNHYLLLADMTLKDAGFGQLLPAVDTVIVDEAHQLDEIADYFFCENFGSRQIENLLDDLEYAKEYQQIPALRKTEQAIRSSIRKLLTVLIDFPERASIQVLKDSTAAEEARHAMEHALQQLSAQLETQRERSGILNSCHARSVNLADNLTNAFTDHNDTVSWYQHEKQSFRFHVGQAYIAPLLQEKYALYDASWIYTSATLAVDRCFDYICKKLGINTGTRCVQLDNPFDFSKQAAFYLPQDLPEPNAVDHTERFVEASYALLDMAKGNSLYLFTSHRALQIAAGKLRREKSFMLFVQGDAPKLQLVTSFCKQPGSLLLGTAGFWEGMDVRGAGLRCVMIDRLPFGKLDDPLVQGRSRLAQESGNNFFAETTVPAAVVALRQGIGRLIRDEADKGVIMLGDIRLFTKSYGKIFLRSLPPMKCYRDNASLRPYLQ